MVRAVMVGVYNEAIFIDSAWNDSGFAYGVSWFNDTVPLGRTEVLIGSEVEDSEIKWGQLYGGVGFGWQIPVSPGYVDNKFLTWLSYDLGYVYDTSNGDLVRQIDEDGFIATLSPDGKNLATMNFESPAVVVFDIETGAIAERYVGLEDQAFDLEYSTDGSLLVGGSRGAGVQV